MKNFPKTISGLGKKVKESKVSLKTSSQSMDKEKSEAARRPAEVEKESIKHLKDDMNITKPPVVEELEFKRIVITDKEKVSLVSDSLKGNDVLDIATTNGATKVDTYNEVISHNAVHVSSV